MNHTFRTKSALTRAAEEGLRREQRRNQSAAIFAVCAFVIAAYIIATIISQVIQ